MEKIEKTDEFREIICKECGKPFYIDIHSMARPRYCSDECKKANAERYYREYCMKKRNAAVNDLGENAVEGVDYVECPICHERRSQLTMTHFKRHGYTSKEQLFKDYPNLQMTRKKQVNEHLVGQNNPMSKANRNELERKQASPYSIEHYLKKYDGDEVLAKQKLDEFLASLDRSTWMENTRIEYYLAKGMTQEEAENALKERQTTNGLDYYIAKYGKEKGTLLYKERLDKWCKKVFKGKTHSERADLCIKYIIEGQEDNNDLLYGENEYAFLHPVSRKIIKPDLTNLKTRKIVEFYGDYWHCNPSIYKEDYINKKSKKTAKEIWEHDLQRLQQLQKYGFSVMIIWEHDYIHDFDNVIKKAKEFIFNNE